ncbi:hypothetical protein AAHA92_24319 [Salvia divinorum]|uniref:Uncharacterized protein n=1 Tax=Salvia divinorum TaxID=28513 RepID=A0ABD1G9P2_SALDI
MSGLQFQTLIIPLPKTQRWKEKKRQGEPDNDKLRYRGEARRRRKLQRRQVVSSSQTLSRRRAIVLLFSRRAGPFHSSGVLQYEVMQQTQLPQ